MTKTLLKLLNSQALFSQTVYIYYLQLHCQPEAINGLSALSVIKELNTYRRGAIFLANPIFKQEQRNMICKFCKRPNVMVCNLSVNGIVAQ